MKPRFDPTINLGHLISLGGVMIVVAGLALMLGGMAWRWYAARQAKALADALDLPQGVAA